MFQPRYSRLDDNLDEENIFRGVFIDRVPLPSAGDR